MRRETATLGVNIPLDRVHTCGSRTCTICNKNAQEPLLPGETADFARNPGFVGEGSAGSLVQDGFKPVEIPEDEKRSIERGQPGTKPGARGAVQQGAKGAKGATPQRSGDIPGMTEAFRQLVEAQERRRAAGEQQQTPTPTPTPDEDTMSQKIARTDLAKGEKKKPRGRPFTPGQDPRRNTVPPQEFIGRGPLKELEVGARVRTKRPLTGTKVGEGTKTFPPFTVGTVVERRPVNGKMLYDVKTDSGWLLRGCGDDTEAADKTFDRVDADDPYEVERRDAQAAETVDETAGDNDPGVDADAGEAESPADRIAQLIEQAKQRVQQAGQQQRAVQDAEKLSRDPETELWVRTVAREEAAKLDAQLAEGLQQAFDGVAADVTAINTRVDNTRQELLATLEQIGTEIPKIVRDAVAQAPGRAAKLEIVVNKRPAVTIEGLTHEKLPEVLEAAELGLNILLVGPAGSGKTTLARHAAEALGRRFGMISCTSGMSESHLTGRLLPVREGGAFDWVGTEFVEWFEQGGGWLFDEVDAADPNVLLVVNAALSGDRLPLPTRIERPWAKRSEEFFALGAANTYGVGADRVYAGRNQLDGAFLSRFAGGVIEVNYDRTMEAALVENVELRDAFWTVRDRVQQNGLRRIWGTRELLAADKLVRAGRSIEYAFRRLASGWKQDELQRAGLTF